MSISKSIEDIIENNVEIEKYINSQTEIYNQLFVLDFYDKFPQLERLNLNSDKIHHITYKDNDIITYKKVSNIYSESLLNNDTVKNLFCSYAVKLQLHKQLQECINKYDTLETIKCKVNEFIDKMDTNHFINNQFISEHLMFDDYLLLKRYDYDYYFVIYKKDINKCFINYLINYYAHR
jgi:hypothetical protein